MQRDSAIYIVGFCVAVCLACSVLVSSAAVGLKPRQVENQALDRQRKVLAVSGLVEEGEYVSADEVRDIFQRRIRTVVVDLEAGSVNSAIDAASYDQQKAKKDPELSVAAPKNPAGVARVPKSGVVYYVSSADMGEDGSGFDLEQYIFPVEGKGLWSTLYGFIALASDGNEIRGLTFYQHGETPGLGGEVDNPSWKAKWPSRLVYGPKGIAAADFGQPSIEVIKGQAGSPEETPHQVDGLSGATITSKGVTYLLQFWLGDNGFGPFLKNAVSSSKG